MTRWDWNPQLPRDSTGIYEAVKDMIERDTLEGEKRLTIDDIQDWYGTNRATAVKTLQWRFRLDPNDCTWSPSGRCAIKRSD